MKNYIYNRYFYVLHIFLIFIFSSSTNGHETAGSFSSYRIPGRTIEFPDTKNHLTIIADLHTHSVFSDGHVWPNIRVAEAQRDGLDAIAITEHLEYQPHIVDIPHKDRNTAYKIAKKAAENSNLIVISGSEITRENPIGHINAIFIEDSNKLFKLDEAKKNEAENLIEQRKDEAAKQDTEMVNHYALAQLWPVANALNEAHKQGGFIFWNHPMWSAADGIAKLSPQHKEFIKNGTLHGIEVVNENTFSEEALAIALEYDLTIIGTSDVHNLIDWDYLPHRGNHRQVTLIFSEKKTQLAIKQALMNGQTAVWYKNLLIGKKQNIQPLLEAILTLEEAKYEKNSEILTINISNNSDAKIQMVNLSDYSFMSNHDVIEVAAHSDINLRVKTTEKKTSISFKFKILNALVAPKTYPTIVLHSAINLQSD